jgi:hypothetical protein
MMAVAELLPHLEINVLDVNTFVSATLHYCDVFFRLYLRLEIWPKRVVQPA